MILYRKEPVPLLMRNMMMLDDVESGGVLYVSKATYDQAVLISSRFDGDCNAVWSTLKDSKVTYSEIPGFMDFLKNYKEKAPEPLNILAGFLGLVAQTKGVDFKEMTLVDAYGFLHSISQMIDFNALSVVPKEVRAKVDIPKVILTSYELSWNEICATLEDHTVLHYSTQPIVQQVPVVTVPTVQVVEEKKEEAPKVEVTTTKVETPVKEEPVKVETKEEVKEEPEEDDFFARLAKAANKAGDKMKKEIADSKKSDKPAPVATPVAPKAEPINPTEAKEALDVLSEYDDV